MTRMTLVVIAVLALTGVSISEAQNPYCSISTCKPAITNNTLCMYTSTTWGASCITPYPTTSTISSAEKDKIVKLHNDYRRTVAQGLETRGLTGSQPPASNMRQLVWDNELATMAQTHAQQCVFKHDTCRDVSRFQVGQNIYMAMSTANIATSNWAGATKSWSDEVQYMNNTFVLNFPKSPPKVIGHYTQMVWATTSTIGCGVVSFNNNGPKYPYNRLYVCNYGPAGNWLTYPVYSQGAAGSACPPETTNNNGLCT